MAIYSRTSLVVLSLDESSMGQVVFKHTIDSEVYRGIYHVNLKMNEGSVTGDVLSQFKCLIACKKVGVTSIDIFDVTDLDDFRTISYLDHADKLMVKISEDNSTVIFSTDKEHYMHDGKIQSYVPQMKEKKIRESVYD